MRETYQVKDLTSLGALTTKLALEWRALAGQKSDAVAGCFTGELGAGPGARNAK